MISIYPCLIGWGYILYAVCQFAVFQFAVCQFFCTGNIYRSCDFYWLLLTLWCKCVNFLFIKNAPELTKGIEKLLRNCKVCRFGVKTCPPEITISIAAKQLESTCWHSDIFTKRKHDNVIQPFLSRHINCIV